MPVLSDESHRAVVEDRNDDGAAVVMDHFALIREFTFADGVDGYAEHAAGEDFLTANRLW
jgi:hypothetical protein